MRVNFKARWLMASLMVLPGASFAQQSPIPASNAVASEMTDCSQGCTIITCDQTNCAVNVFDSAGWSISANYPTPSSLKSATNRSHPVRQELATAQKGNAASASSGGELVLSPTSAELQYAKVCKADADNACSFYTVGVKGAMLLKPAS